MTVQTKSRMWTNKMYWALWEARACGFQLSDVVKELHEIWIDLLRDEVHDAERDYAHAMEAKYKR